MEKERVNILYTFFINLNETRMFIRTITPLGLVKTEGLENVMYSFNVLLGSRLRVSELHIMM